MAKVVQGSRIGRLGRLAALSGRVGGSLVARAANRFSGGDGSEAQRWAAQQLVETLGRMKGLAQKVGQALSMDVDHLPPEVREVIASLQGKSEPLDAAAIVEVVEDSLGAPLDSLFDEFERQPFAAASLGQVHRARLADGRRVAVKVQYPGIRRALEADLENVGMLVRTVGLLGGPFDGKPYYDEVRREIEKEVDYRREAQSGRRFAELLSRHAGLAVPGVVAERSSDRVLTTELLDGKPLSEVLKASQTVDPELRYRLACGLAAALFGPFLGAGVVHADPHPGNFVVLPDGRLGVLDFGAVKELSPPFAEAHRTLYRAALSGRLDSPVELLEHAGFTLTAPRQEVAAFVGRIFDIIRRPVAEPFYDFGPDRMTADLRALVRSNFKTSMGLRPPPEGLLFFRAIFGQSMNFRALHAAGDFRRCYEEILRASIP